MGRIAKEQPLQTLLDVQDVRNADDHVAAGLQHPRELAHRLLWVLNMLQPFEAGDIIERAIGERQLRIKIASMNVNAVEPKDFRIEIAAANVEARIDQTRRQGTFTRRHVEQRAARLAIENIDDGVVDRLMRERGLRRGLCSCRRTWS